MTRLHLHQLARRAALAHRTYRLTASRDPLTRTQAIRRATLAGCMECDSQGLGIIPVLGIVKGVAAVAQAVPAIKSLVGGKISKSEAVWDAYKPGAGKSLGRNYDPIEFAEVVKGAFDTNRNIFAVDRESLMAQLAGAMVAAIKNNAVSASVTAPEMFAKVIKPFLSSSGKVNMARFDGHAIMAPLFTDIADRYLNNLPITRADIPGIRGGPYTIHAPLLFDALGVQATPGGAISPEAGASQPAAPVIPLAPKTPDPVATLPAALAPIVATLPSFAPGGPAAPGQFPVFAPAVVPGAPPPATPDRLPLYIGIGAGAAILLTVLLTQRRGR